MWVCDSTHFDNGRATVQQGAQRENALRGNLEVERSVQHFGEGGAEMRGGAVDA